MKNLQIESTSLDELMAQIRGIFNEIKEQPFYSSQEENELWTREETANFFQVTYQTLHNWKKNEILIPVTVGTRVYYHKSDIDNLISKKGENHED